MRQIFIFILVAGIVSCKGSSSPISVDNENHVRDALIGKWESTFIETSASRIEVPKEMVTMVTYEPNGTYDSRKKGSAIGNTGNWSYNPKTHLLNNSSKGVYFNNKLVSLTDKELVVIGYTTVNDEIIDSTIETYKKL